MTIEGIHYATCKKISIEIKNGIIQNIREIGSFSSSAMKRLHLAPAFFDNQINGYLGIEFSKPDLTPEDMVHVVRALRNVGVVSFLPTVITASQESLLRSFSNLALALEEPDVSYSVPGFHLEGPYISPKAGYRGAHTLKQIRKPDWDEFRKINEAAKGKILQITLAPEIEGAIPFIEKCVQNSIVVSLGHHNATSEEIKKAIDAGAKTVTHLGNGLANEINRFKNPLWMQLAEDRLMCSLIVDGFHLLPEMVKVFYRAKGESRMILTSDMTMLAGLAPGKYIWDGKDVVLTPEGIIMYPEENVFAGASLPLAIGVSNMMEFSGCTLKEAVNMSTKNPAQLYGIDDRGILAPGKRADIIFFELENRKLNLLKIMKSGEFCTVTKN